MIVDLGDVEVPAADDTVGLLRVHVRRRTPRPSCETCGRSLCSDGDRREELGNCCWHVVNDSVQHWD